MQGKAQFGPGVCGAMCLVPRTEKHVASINQ
jgi:hypothetical protein